MYIQIKEIKPFAVNTICIRSGVFNIRLFCPTGLLYILNKLINSLYQPGVSKVFVFELKKSLLRK